jgi:hypothetical protein
MPLPKDGKDGVSMSCFEFDGGRIATFRSIDGEKSVVIKFPFPLYKGVFREGTAYELGDVATWGGNAWVAKKDTAEKPGASEAWQLFVKKGADGRDRT